MDKNKIDGQNNRDKKEWKERERRKNR
jgi:hypothetical protein